MVKSFSAVIYITSKVVCLYLFSFAAFSSWVKGVICKLIVLWVCEVLHTNVYRFLALYWWVWFSSWIMSIMRTKFTFITSLTIKNLWSLSVIITTSEINSSFPCWNKLFKLSSSSRRSHIESFDSILKWGNVSFDYFKNSLNWMCPPFEGSLDIAILLSVSSKVIAITKLSLSLLKNDWAGHQF